MEYQRSVRHSSAPWTARRLVQLLAALVLVAGFILAGGPTRADIPDHTGHAFHNQLLCDPASFARSTHLIAWKLDNKPASVYLTLKNTKTGAVLQSDVASSPSVELVPGLVEWDWTWTRAGDDAAWGPDEAWATYTWPDGSSTWEHLTDVGLYPGGSVPGNTICVLWLPGA